MNTSSQSPDAIIVEDASVLRLGRPADFFFT